MPLSRRGGVRKSSGRPSPWGRGVSTKQIRVPSEFADEIFELALLLYGNALSLESSETIKLPKGEVQVYKLGDREVVLLKDLKQIGYGVKKNKTINTDI